MRECAWCGRGYDEGEGEFGICEGCWRIAEDDPGAALVISLYADDVRDALRTAESAPSSSSAVEAA